MIIEISKNFILDVGNGTDTGRVRQKNEDYLESFSSDFGQIFIVCDGMGGHVAGEIASRLAIATIKDYIMNNPDNMASSKKLIVEAINRGNNAIIEKWKDEPQLQGMGTTIVLLMIKENVAYHACVGDSRIYILRNSKLYQITKDQSFVQTLVDSGVITYQDAEHHPRKNEILQALGIKENITVALNEIALDLYTGDTLLLCSDGLSGMLNDDNIEKIVRANAPQEAVKKLIDAANSNGGIDNITVQIIKVAKGLSIPASKKNLPPAGALIKDNNIQNNSSQHRNFDKTTEIPEYNIHRKKKGMLPLYFGMVILIAIFVVLILKFTILKNNNEAKVNATKTDSTEVKKDSTKNIVPKEKKEVESTKKPTPPEKNNINTNNNKNPGKSKNSNNSKKEINNNDNIKPNDKNDEAKSKNEPLEKP